MASKRKKKAAVKDAVTTVVVMRLYIAGRAPNSVKAIANLEAICREHLKDSYKLEIVVSGVIMLLYLVAHVIGNLSATSSVLAALGVQRAPAR